MKKFFINILIIFGFLTVAQAECITAEQIVEQIRYSLKEIPQSMETLYQIEYFANQHYNTDWNTVMDAYNNYSDDGEWGWLIIEEYYREYQDCINQQKEGRNE
jgi:hypothetical protein